MKWGRARVLIQGRLLLLALVAGGWGAAVAVGEDAAELAQAAPPDPATQIVTPLLSDDVAACRKLFEQLASDDFDTRERALNALVAKGPAILPLAKEFEKHSDAEIATQAKALPQRILLTYDGYLATSPGLKAALRKATVKLAPGKKHADLLTEAARKAGVKLVFDPNVKPADGGFEFNDDGGRVRPEMRLEDYMGQFLAHAGVRGITRGDVYLVTTLDKAQTLAIQRHTFDWSGLQLGRDEAERAGKAWQPFFSAHTEIHTASEVLTIRGDEESITRAARLIALLKPGAPDAVWPAPPAGEAPAAPAALLAKLAAPARLALAAEDPLDALEQLKAQGHQVFLATGDDPNGEARQEPPFPASVSGASPLRLSLPDLPLGLVLRWMERRTKFPAEQQTDLILGFEMGPGGRLQFRQQAKSAEVLKQYLAGADVSFLYPRGAKPSAESDAAVCTALLETLDSHLALFPSLNTSRDVTVLRGRLFMQGRCATLARILDLVREWRAKNAPPAPAAWKEALEARLNFSLEWDGRGMTGGRVIGALRKLGQAGILLEDAPDGSAAQFELTAQDAQLLPPGKHTLRALLDDLAKKAGAQWRVELGVIVLTPKTEERKRARQ